MLCVVGVVQNIYSTHIALAFSSRMRLAFICIFSFLRFLSLLLLFLFIYIYIQQYFLPFSLYSILCGLNVCLLARTQQGQEPGKKRKKKKMGFLYPVFPSACDIVSFFFFFFLSLLFSFLSPHCFLILLLLLPPFKETNEL